jgi:iron(III) transport system substrate-binding protein
MMRSRLVLSVVLTAALGVTGCGGGTEKAKLATGSWDNVVSAADGEGKVTIYSSQGTQQLDDVAARFNKKYPKIKVEVVRGLDGELAPKVEAEKRTGKGIADVFVSASLPWITANASGYEKPLGPSFDAAAYDKATSVPASSYFLINAAILTFGWNTKLYPKGLKDYSDLLAPELAGGKIGVIKPAAPSMVDFYLYLEENYGADFVKKLAAQKPRIYPSALPMGQALTSGEIAAGSFVQPLIDEKTSGAPVDWGLAKKSWGALFYGMALKSAPHPNAAQLLADFLVTDQGQQAIARKGASVLPDITGAVGATANVRRQDPAKLTPDKVKEYQASWDKMFGG